VPRLEDADILCLNGGADIGTEIYNESPIHDRWMMSPKWKSRRDREEIEQYEEAKASGKFIFGICRGAQLVTCLEGGSLWQHVDRHYGDHPIRDELTKKIYSATSVHHQMMRPNKAKPYLLIAAADESAYKVSEHDEWKYPEKGELDPEIVWYPEARALCVQGHPEYAVKSPFANYCTDLIHSLWANGVWPPEKASAGASV
jgi:gamma-glutamyl-gamma-aminobutyrate hydrolase PuuD